MDGDLLLGELRTVTTNGNVPDPAVISKYTWGPTGLVCMKTLPSSGLTLQTYFFQFGPQGETRLLTNQFASPVAYYDYTAYGLIGSRSGVDQPRNPFLFGGQFGYWSDIDWDLNPTRTLCGTRWYSPVYARWLSRDPSGYDGGDNLYGYCYDDPVNMTDPIGLQGSQLVTKSAEQVFQTTIHSHHVQQLVGEEIVGQVAKRAMAQTVGQVGLAGVLPVAGQIAGALSLAVTAYAAYEDVRAAIVSARCAENLWIDSGPIHVPGVSAAANTVNDLKKLAGPAEKAWREALVKMYPGLTLAEKQGANLGGPDATVIGAELPGWRFAELKHLGTNGRVSGLSQIRGRFRAGIVGPAALYFWYYDGSRFHFAQYVGRASAGGIITPR